MNKLEFLEALLEEIEELNTFDEIVELLQTKIEEAEEEREFAVDNTEEDEEF
jgi:hypothetical protein